MALENYKALTIAGSDTSGGAGMEADLKTFEEMGVYGMVALTVIVAQNPKDWAHDIFPIDLPTIERQIATVGEGIGINAMKTGMLGSAALVELVAKSIDKYNFCSSAFVSGLASHKFLCSASSKTAAIRCSAQGLT